MKCHGSNIEFEEALSSSPSACVTKQIIKTSFETHLHIFGSRSTFTRSDERY